MTFELKQILQSKDWQSIQDSFSSVTGISVRLLDERGGEVNSPSGVPRLCRQIVENSPYRDSHRMKCLPTFLGGTQVLDSKLSYSCLPGLFNFISPITIENNKLLAYLVAGPVFLIVRPSKEVFLPFTEELKVDIEELWQALLEIKVTSLQGMTSLVQLIKHIAEFSVKNARKQQELVQEFASDKRGKVLSVLLDVAFQLSGADIGSIMCLQKDSNVLAIESSRGIQDEVVRTARLGLGEGIAGLAAQENKAFIVDETLPDQRIRSRLNRPQIKSAMVVPIQTNRGVIGVINLGVFNNSPVKFGQEDVSLVNRLIGLASVVIEPCE